jgi:hypothetical protein
MLIFYEDKNDWSAKYKKESQKGKFWIDKKEMKGMRVKKEFWQYQHDYN